MKPLRSVFVHLTIILLLVAVPVAAQQKSDSEKIKEIELMAPVTTEHSLVIGGETYDYEATVGYFVQRDEKENPVGYFFYTAYRLKGKDISRPLTFVFNGGPGSSSIYLHMLTVGPKLAVLDDEGNTPGPPPTMEDNQHTWLPFTDLVFVDPIGTGFSFPHPGSDTKNYWGAAEDASSVAEFIRQYLTENGRWLSPIVIAGESYGGIRGPLLAAELRNNRRIKLNVSGLVFISPAFDYQSLAISKHNIQYLSQYMPTLAATGWHHGLVDRAQYDGFGDFIAEVVQWSRNDYLLALQQGDQLSAEGRQETAEKIASYTGLELDYVLQEDLRILSPEFREQLMAHKGMALDRLDARWQSGKYELTTTLSPVLNHYIREELGYKTSKPYVVMGRVSPWPYNSFMGFSVVDTLKQLVEEVPNLKVLVTMGYYDYACPFTSIDYALDQLLLKPELQKNVLRRYYHAGHMVYTPKDELARYTQDVAEFYEALVK